MCVSNEDGSYISTDLLSVSFRPLLTKEMLASEDREEECEEEDTILQIGQFKHNEVYRYPYLISTN